MGVMQHHDAVSGTEKQFVANDYSRILYESMDHAGEIISKAIRYKIFSTNPLSRMSKIDS